MKEQSLRRQAAVTAGGNAAVRMLGFGMRLAVTRLLGAEAVGVMELAASAHMAALTAAAAGLPGAVSRVCARATEQNRHAVLQAGRGLALRSGLLISGLLLALSPLLSRLLGDARTLPSLLLLAPSVAVVALSSVYDGYFFGVGNAWPPMLSELAEQLARLAITLTLLLRLPTLSVAGRAAVPALALAVGEACGLAVVMRFGKGSAARVDPARLPPIRKRLTRLALPLTASRLSHTGLRALCSVLIPLRLAAGGMEHGAAMRALGMLSGMVTPLLLLPGMLAGALGTVGGPAAAKCRGARAENRLALRLAGCSLAVGLLCAAGLYALAPTIAVRLYRTPEAAALLRRMCPLAVLMPLQQALSGVMTGLGLQKKTLLASLLGAAATLLCTWLWTPNGGITGAGMASLAGHALSLLCSVFSFLCRDTLPCGKMPVDGLREA